MLKTASPRASVAAHSHAGDLVLHHLQHLEARTHLSAFGATDLIEHLGLDAPLFDLAAPIDIQSAGFGAALAGLGDIDADGRADFAIAAPGRAASGADPAVPGRVFIYSGATGALLRTLSGEAHGFGHALLAAGDQNGDDIPDLLVGSPFANDEAGRALLYSGADGSLLRTLDGVAAGDRFGWSLALVRDQNTDGRGDFAIGAPGASDGRGTVSIITTVDTTVLVGAAPGDEFGYAISTLPAVPEFTDVHVALILVGSPGAADQAGRADLYAADGATRASFTGARAGDRFGHAVLALAEPTTVGDLRTVLFIASPGADGPREGEPTAATDRGSVFTAVKLSSNSNPFSIGPEILGHPAAGAGFGSYLASLGDLDGDGRAEVAIAAPGASHASVQFSSLLTGGLRHSPVLRGGPIVLAPDVNADGFAEVITSDGAGAVRILPVLAAGDPPPIAAASDNGAYIWFRGGLATPDGLIADHLLFGGLRFARVEGISDAGLIVISAAETSDGPRTLYIADDAGSDPVPLASTITMREGGPDTDDFTLIAISGAGHIALTSIDEALEDPFGNRPVWVLHDGVLTFLFYGQGVDVNNSGRVVGTRFDVDPLHGARTFTAVRARGEDLGLTSTLVFPQAIDDSGRILGGVPGEAELRTLAIYDAGAVTSLPFPAPSGFRPSIVRFDNTGRITADYYGEPGGFPSIQRFIWTADEGWRQLDPLVHGARLPTLSITLIPLSDGRMLADNQVLTPIDDDDVWVLRPGSPTASLDLVASSYFVAVNQFDEVIAFRTDGGQVARFRLAPQPVGDVELAIGSGSSGVGGLSPAVFVLERGAGRIARIGIPLIDFPGNLVYEPTPITRGLTVFTSPDHRRHFAGLDAAGDVILEFEVRQLGMPTFWAIVNLSETHLRAQNLTSPAFVGGLTSYVTEWDGRNIAGVDENGQIHVLWWAPGLGDLWRVDNLSDIAGAPAVAGPLTAYLTHWDGINLAATDAAGNVVVTWWAPGTVWSWNDLTDITGGPRLALTSLDSYATYWGGLNIVGTDAATGDVTIYWWAPGGEWTAERIIPEGADEPARLAAPVAHATANGVMQIYGASDDDTPVQLTWKPGMPIWRLIPLASG